jgi:hypothetical protein
LCPSGPDWSRTDILSGQWVLVSIFTPPFSEMSLTANASRVMDRAGFFLAPHSPFTKSFFQIP